MRGASLCWSIALAAASLCVTVACGSPEREPPPAEERTSDEPIVVVPPPLIDDEPSALGLPSPQTYEVLESLTRLVDPAQPASECALLAEENPSASFGSVLAPYVRGADEREVVCTPTSGGFQCRVSLVKHTGGDDAEWGVFLDLHLDAAHAIDPRSIACHLAG